MYARLTAGLLLGSALVLAVPLAKAKEAAVGAGEARQQLEEAEVRKQLEEAQRELEEAAREVARLSVELGGPMRQALRMRLPGGGRAVLGVNIDNAGPGTDGVRVVSVSPGGPAAAAGVQSGDLIVAIEGRKVGTGRELVETMRRVEPGQKVALDIRRGGKPVSVTVEARAAHDVDWDFDFELPDIDLQGLPPLHALAGHPGMPGMHFLLGPWGDAEFATMTPALGRYFGTEQGLLVVRSPKAAGVELEDGDVILAIGGREPQDGGHALRILRSYQPGETVELKVLRQRKERTVKMVIPEGPRHAAPHAIIKRSGAGKDEPGSAPVVVRKEVRKEPPKAPAPPAPPPGG